MQYGQIYKPYRLFCGSFIPEWLESRKEISGGAKLCFARLLRFCGKNDICNPRLEVLADKLGMAKRTIQRYLKELETYKLIKIKQNGLNKSNHYYFLWHEWIDFGMANMAIQEVTDLSTPEWTNLSPPIIKEKEENHIEENQFIYKGNGHSDSKSKPSEIKRAEYRKDEFFMRMMKTYPTHLGTQDWIGAFNQYKARLKEGYTTGDIWQGILKYKEHCEVRNISSEYILMLKTFLGKKYYFTHEWRTNDESRLQTGGNNYKLDENGIPIFTEKPK